MLVGSGTASLTHAVLYQQIPQMQTCVVVITNALVTIELLSLSSSGCTIRLVLCMRFLMSLVRCDA